MAAKTFTVVYCCLFVISLTQDLNTRRDPDTNVIIWTINAADCPNKPVAPLQEGDCDCDDTSENINYDTPCCGIDPKQCNQNGAIGDIDEVEFTQPNSFPGTPIETQVKPPDGEECDELSPPYIFPGDPDICSILPRYKAIKAPNGASLSHDGAQALCEAHETTLATINPFDRNFDSNILVSYIKQYRDIVRTCLLGNAQDNEFTFDPCWVGALSLVTGSNQGCEVWQLRNKIYQYII